MPEYLLFHLSNSASTDLSSYGLFYIVFLYTVVVQKSNVFADIMTL